jgi:hypothetical protein
MIDTRHKSKYCALLVLRPKAFVSLADLNLIQIVEILCCISAWQIRPGRRTPHSRQVRQF